MTLDVGTQRVTTPPSSRGPLDFTFRDFLRGMEGRRGVIDPASTPSDLRYTVESDGFRWSAAFHLTQEPNPGGDFNTATRASVELSDPLPPAPVLEHPRSF